MHNDQDKEDESETLLTKEFLWNMANSSINQSLSSKNEVDSTLLNSRVDDSIYSANELDQSIIIKESNIMMNSEILFFHHYKIKIIQNLELFTNLLKLSKIENFIEKIQEIEKWKE